MLNFVCTIQFYQSIVLMWILQNNFVLGKVIIGGYSVS